MRTAKKMIVILLIGLLLVIAYKMTSFFILDASIGKVPTEIQVAHRGGAAYFPENTLEAVENAYDMNLAMVEIDVRMSRDGELILMHDQTVSRTTNGDGRVGELTLQQLLSLQVGEEGNYQVPTLKEVLLLSRPAATKIILEIKEPKRYPGISKKILRILKETNSVEDVIVMSFDKKFIKEFKLENPAIQVGTLHILPMGFDQGVEISYVGIHWSNLILFDGIIQNLRRRNIRVMAWTVNDDRMKKRVYARGIDGIITDNPVQVK